MSFKDTEKNIISIINDDELSKYNEYYLVRINKSLPESAFLADAYKVENKCPRLLSFYYDAAPEYGEILDFETYQVGANALEDDDERDCESVKKALRPEVTVLDGSRPVVYYHLNRTKDGIVEITEEIPHDLPIVFYNIGEQALKIAGKKIERGEHEILTIESPSRAKRRKEENEMWEAYLNSPCVAQSVKETQAQWLNK